MYVYIIIIIMNTCISYTLINRWWISLPTFYSNRTFQKGRILALLTSLWVLRQSVEWKHQRYLVLAYIYVYNIIYIHIPYIYILLYIYIYNMYIYIYMYIYICYNKHYNIFNEWILICIKVHDMLSKEDMTPSVSDILKKDRTAKDELVRVLSTCIYNISYIYINKMYIEYVYMYYNITIIHYYMNI